MYKLKDSAQSITAAKINNATLDPHSSKRALWKKSKMSISHQKKHTYVLFVEVIVFEMKQDFTNNQDRETIF